MSFLGGLASFSNGAMYAILPPDFSTSKERFKTFLERPRSLTESHRVAHSHTLKLEIRCASDAYSGKDRREKSRASAAAMARAAERGARSSPRAPI